MSEERERTSTPRLRQVVLDAEDALGLAVVFADPAGHPFCIFVLGE